MPHIKVMKDPLLFIDVQIEVFVPWTIKACDLMGEERSIVAVLKNRSTNFDWSQNIKYQGSKVLIYSFVFFWSFVFNFLSANWPDNYAIRLFQKIFISIKGFCRSLNDFTQSISFEQFLVFALGKILLNDRKLQERFFFICNLK